MRRFAIAALALLLTGCLNEPTAPSTSVLAGTWNITSVNNQPLPFTFSNGTTLTSGQMTLQANGAYQSLEHYSNGVDYTEDGAYTIYGTDLLFADAISGLQYGAHWDAQSITKSAGSYSIAYRKQ
jgi:lipocalin-like protein